MIGSCLRQVVLLRGRPLSTAVDRAERVSSARSEPSWPKTAQAELEPPPKPTQAGPGCGRVRNAGVICAPYAVLSHAVVGVTATRLPGPGEAARPGAQ